MTSQSMTTSSAEVEAWLRDFDIAPTELNDVLEKRRRVLFAQCEAHCNAHCSGHGVCSGHTAYLPGKPLEV